MSGINIHVLVSEEKHEWRDRCLGELAHEPVNVFVLRGAAGATNAGRQRGFSYGTAPYAGFVDPDDRIKRGAFVDAHRALKHDKADLWLSGEGLIDQRGRWQGKNRQSCVNRDLSAINAGAVSMHGLCVFSREFLTRFVHYLARLDILGEWLLVAAAFKHGRVMQDTRPLRLWRRHPDQASRRITRAQVTATRALIDAL